MTLTVCFVWMACIYQNASVVKFLVIITKYRIIR
jgi:hypothetical protein